MGNKNFFEIFSKYSPPSEFVEILRSAGNIRSRADKENRILEIRADFQNIISKNTLYRIEAGIKEAYKLNVAKILPHYPAVLFDYNYIPEILKETEEVGVVAKGFFSDYDYKLDKSDNSIVIELPFGVGGINLLEDANTPRVIENIINSEFSIASHVKIIHKDSGFNDYESSRRQMLEQIDEQIKRADQEYSSLSRNSAPSQTVSDDTPSFPRISSFTFPFSSRIR